MELLRTQDPHAESPLAVTGSIDDARRGTVAHVVLAYVERSETFIPETIRALEEVGWEPRIVAEHLLHRDAFTYPRDEWIHLVQRPPAAQLVANRLLLRNKPARQSTWLQPGLAAVKPDVVHAHFGQCAAAAAPAARRLGLPLVATFHGTDLTAWPREHAWTRRSYRWVFRYASCLIVPSEFLAQKLHEVGYDGPVEIAPAGIDTAAIPFTGPRPRSADGCIRLLLVARQHPVKGTDVLLRALPAVAERHPKVTLDVIGYGPDAERNEALAGELGCADRVRFLGGRPHDETLAAIRSADVVVIPSRRAPSGDEESSSLVTREALATGVPVVASRSGGIPDNFPPEQRAALVMPDEPPALAQRILAVLESPAANAQRARVGRRWIEQEFDSRALAERIARVYDRVQLSGSRGGS